MFEDEAVLPRHGTNCCNEAFFLPLGLMSQLCNLSDVIAITWFAISRQAVPD
jgi:hypothetical protein